MDNPFNDLLGVQTPPSEWIKFHLDTTPKGLQTFTIDLDEYELDATGTKVKNGRPTQYMTFKRTKGK